MIAYLPYLSITKKRRSRTFLRIIMATSFYLLPTCMFSCQIPLNNANKNLVPIYVLDKRDLGGEIQITLERPYLTGQAEAEQHIEVHYVSPDIAKRLAENPELINSLIKK